MNLLDFFFIISGTLLFFLSLDVAKKQRFNALHFFVFLFVGSGLLIFTFFPNILNVVGNFFGIARGADVLVYMAIIFLLYFSLLLLSKHIETKESITKLVRELAIAWSKQTYIEGEVCILVRAYNEASMIQEVIEGIYTAWYTSILVIDDGSTDASTAVYHSLSDKITLVSHSINRWAGAALETGFEYLRRFSKIEYVVNFDADGQHKVEDLPKFLTELKKDATLEVVLGSRFLSKNNSKNIPIIRKFVLLWGKFFTFFTSHVYLTDSHNGYRAFRFSAIKKLSLSIDWMWYASELIEQIAKKNLKFAEVPVNIIYTKYSLEKGQKSSNAIGIALRFIWNKFFR